MCGEKIAKIILIIINIAFFVGGGVILAVGIIAHVKEDWLFKITDFVTGTLADSFSDLKVLTNLDLYELIRSNAVILIVVGSILFGIGFLGCCGAMRKNSFCLNLYAVVVIVILAGEVGLGVYAYMYSDKLESQIKDGLRIAMDHYYVNGMRISGTTLVPPTDAEEISWDALQLELQCCGITGKEDWLAAVSWDRIYTFQGQSFVATLPPTCCLRTETGQEITDYTLLTSTDFVDFNGCMQTATNGSFHAKGCYTRLRDIVFDNKNLIIIIFCVIVGVEILAISCACWLKKQANKDD